MIDVGGKNKTKRMARAQAIVKLGKKIIKLIQEKKNPKGDVLECARIAGILAAKNTSEIIPFCHNIPLDFVGIEFELQKEKLFIRSTVKSEGKTGVEMETLTAVSVAALTVYDMCKILSKSIELESIFLLEKRGGKSGGYER